MKRLIILSIVLLVATGGGIGLYLFNKKPADIRKEEAAFHVTAIMLLKEFNDNDTLASKKYVDKVVEVAGTISSIDKATSTVFLDTGDPVAAITCSFYSDESASLANLKSGDAVKIKGKCTGKLMDIVFNECSIKKEN